MRVGGLGPVVVEAPVMEELSDAELVSAMRLGGDTPGSLAGTTLEAEAELFRRFAPRIELYGRRHLGNAPAAKDLVQDVLLRVVQAIRSSRLENPASLASFVLGTCRNVTWDARRAEARHSRIAREAAAHGVPAVEEAAEPLEQRSVLSLFGCMNGLPEREAMIVRMSFWEDRSAEDIGARLGLSAGNVRVIRHRALGKLVICMNREHAA